MTIDRPLKLGELFAHTVELYGRRIRAVAGLGTSLAGMIVLARLAPVGVDLAVLARGLTACYAASARVAAGDSFAEACAQAIHSLPVLLVLTLVVSVPLALALTDALLVLVVVAWVTFSGFSIPVAVLEREPDANWLGQVGNALSRSVWLARVEYLHALGVCAALALVWLLFGRVLTVLLTGFADNGSFAAFLIAQAVLGPFFFLGLSVLYFEQKVRAVSSRSDRTRRPDAEVPDAVDPE